MVGDLSRLYSSKQQALTLSLIADERRSR